MDLILIRNKRNVVDPVTASLNAAAALFNFLATQQGQNVVAQFIQLDNQFIAKLKDLFDKIHGTAAAPSK